MTATAPQPVSLDVALRQAVAHHQAGRLQEAEQIYRAILHAQPYQADANHNLGVLAGQVGQHAAGLPYLKTALTMNPAQGQYALSYAQALLTTGQAGEALAILQAAKQRGCNTQAAQALRRKAEAAMRNVPATGDAPTLAEIDRLVALFSAGSHIEMEGQARLLLERHPDSGIVWKALGVALRMQGKEALPVLQKAVELSPDDAEAHSNLANELQDLRQLDDAVASYQRALEINPDFAGVHGNLGKALRDLGRLDSAAASHAQALKLQPGNLKHAIHAHLLLPSIPDTPDALLAWRENYRTGIAALMDMPGALEEPGDDVVTSSFYLSYHNFNNCTLMAALCRFFRSRLPGLTTPSPHIANWRPPITRGQRIRVGFLSEYLVHHTIGKLYQGFIQHLDRNRFEVVVIRTAKAKQDSISQHIDALADRALTLPTRLEDQQQAVMAEKLDVLFYPDIGMTPSTYFLAYARLAPVQAVAWGHPDTTGLDTLDYFISAQSIEPEDAEAHYTERLIRLNRLPCFYQPLIAPTEIPGRVALGLPETGMLYGCPQSLFKFHPDFDAVLAAIAEGDPAGRIVLLDGLHYTAQLRARWAKTAPLLLERVLFLPPMPLDRFMALLAHLDVLLDPIHFGSGNTLYEAMVYGAPVVTWAGQFMRGRIVAAAYRQMGVNDAPIAPRLEDYAPLALALGRDPERRRSLRQSLREAADRELFADMQSVRELEIFLEAAVAAAGRGEKLPTGWKPDIPVSL
ncbi:MAG: tetratricopeptide repeat protein [Sulfuricellaceae bacterium]